MAKGHSCHVCDNDQSSNVVCIRCYRVQTRLVTELTRSLREFQNRFTTARVANSFLREIVDEQILSRPQRKAS